MGGKTKLKQSVHKARKQERKEGVVQNKLEQVT